MSISVAFCGIYYFFLGDLNLGSVFISSADERLRLSTVRLLLYDRSEIWINSSFA